MADHQLRISATQGGPFSLLRVANNAQSDGAILHIYLGGDGLPWMSDRPSPDPSGQRLLALELMALDPAPALFVGRPCYHQSSMPANCRPELWTSGRYSEPVIESMTESIRAEIELSEASEVVLIGYSGGGTIAMLTAPRLADLAAISVITVAANLDISTWTSYHRLLPLSTSLNPSNLAPSGLSEIHLLGDEDKVVPAITVENYSHRHPQAKFVFVEGFDHRCCWARYWPQILPRALAGRP